MQNPIGVEVLEAEEDLVEVSRDDGLGEDAVLVEEAGDAAARHPLHEHVDVGRLLDGAVHAHDVRVLQTLNLCKYCKWRISWIVPQID